MNTDSIIGSDGFDSRDVIERIAELEADESRNEIDDEELATLREFAKDAKDSAPDWEYGASFIRDDKFEDYAREFASDIGAISEDIGWPGEFIDWPAATDALKQDYSSVTLAGYEYWTRG